MKNGKKRSSGAAQNSGQNPNQKSGQKAGQASSGADSAGAPEGGRTPVKPDKTLWGTVADRRVFPDRRGMNVEGQLLNAQGEAVDEDSDSGFERRRGPGRRLSDFTRSAEEGGMTKEQFLFLVAIDEFKKANGRPYPTWTDVLEVIRLLGYRKTCASEISLRRAEDWREAGDAKSNVRPPRWAEHGKKTAA
jgi:hypothetical protein